MTNMLQDGATWLAARLKESAGRSVVYSRGVLTSSAITATNNQQEYTVVDQVGFPTSVVSSDWTFTTADLVVNGSAVTPRPGDRITETLNSTTIVYEVVSLGSRPCSEWLDTGGIVTLVHTKRIT